jgi:predicted phage tail protein
VQQQASTELLDRLVDRVDRMVSAIQNHQEALRLLQQQQNEWREQMRIIQTEIATSGSTSTTNSETGATVAGKT